MGTVEGSIVSLKKQLPADIANLLDKRDGPEQIVPLLRSKYDPSPASQEGVWDLSALAYSIQSRHHESLSIYYAMYEQLMAVQTANGVRVHKGTPLVRISDEHRALGNSLMAKRYLMLTMCEDAISLGGKINAETTGTYFRSVWQFGISPEQVKNYASRMWGLSLEKPVESRFPEWILQELDQLWMTEYPSSGEATLWAVNTSYIQWLLAQLGGGSGLQLERLAHYLLSSIPGFRAQMRVRSESTDYDIICAPEGLAYDFRSELGRYFLCECKDWDQPADVTAVIKFAGVLRSVKCRFGIIFSKRGISGENQAKYAQRELLKIFQQDDLTIIVFSEPDLLQIASGDNFFSILRDKYEQVRLDLPKRMPADGGDGR